MDAFRDDFFSLCKQNTIACNLPFQLLQSISLSAVRSAAYKEVSNAFPTTLLQHFHFPLEASLVISTRAVFACGGCVFLVRQRTPEVAHTGFARKGCVFLSPSSLNSQSAQSFPTGDFSLAGFFALGETFPGAYRSPQGTFPLGDFPPGGRRFSAPIGNSGGFFPYGILPLRVDDFPAFMRAPRELFPQGIFPLRDSSLWGRYFPAPIGTSREPFLYGILPLGADASQRLQETPGSFSLVGFFALGETLPSAYRSPRGIFSLRVDAS